MTIPHMFTTFLFGAVTLLAIIVVGYYKWKHQYWARKKLKYLKPTVPFGNVPNLFNLKENLGFTLTKHYFTMKERGWRHGGIYLMDKPVYVPVDPIYVRNILTKDFHHFSDRGYYHNAKYEPISDHLFLMHGTNKWKVMRAKITPTFTSNRMKMMFQTVLDCLDNVLSKIGTQIQDNNPTFSMKDLAGCLTLDVIGSCAFGLDLATFKQETSPFKRYSKKLFMTSKMRTMRRIFATAFPNLAEELGVPTVPKDVADFFADVIRNTVNFRESSNFSRKDFIQLLIDLKSQNELTMDEVAAQCFAFFLAGFETSSTVISYALYELCKHPQMQQAVREEVNTVLDNYDHKLAYDALKEMTYLSQVIEETLRKHPVKMYILRKCTKDYKIPDKDIVIEKGTMVVVPLYAIHHDPNYYPDPNTFDPERFSPENKRNIKPYTYMPFGEGPRNCIGMRFGWMEVKATVATLIQKYHLTLNEKTIEPLKVRPTAFILESQHEIWLDFQQI